jgi:flagellin
MLSTLFVNPANVDNSTTNELIKSYRDQGITVTTKGTSVSISLNGDAANNYKVVNDGTTDFMPNDKSKMGKIFYINDLEGVAVSKVYVYAGSIDGSVTMVADRDTLKAQKSSKELSVFYDKDGNAIAANALGNYFDVSGGKPVAKAGAQLYDAVGTALDMDNMTNYITVTKDLTAALNVKFQVGADTSSVNKISINIEAMTAKGLGINGLKVDGTDSTNADSAVNTIAEALRKVSSQRSNLGAIQNRLEHTIKNLDNVIENTSSAESSIRDTDMSTMTVAYSNANILAQAGQSMLAQANQSNQGVLALLS